MSNNDTPKRNAAITAETNEQGLTLTFANGKRLSLDIEQLNPTMQALACVHGLKQKLVDAAAISRDPETGRSATVDDKYQAVKAVYDRLLAGEWNAARGEGGGTGGLLYRALCRMQPSKPAEAIKAWLDGKTDKEKAALRLNPKVAAVIETIRAESAKAGDVDSDSLLDELGE